MVRVDGLGWKNCFIWRCRVRTTNQSATSTQKMQDNKVSVGRTQKGKNYNCNIGWTTHQHHHNHRHPHRMYSFVEQVRYFRVSAIVKLGHDCCFGRDKGNSNKHPTHKPRRGGKRSNRQRHWSFSFCNGTTTYNPIWYCNSFPIPSTTSYNAQRATKGSHLVEVSLLTLLSKERRRIRNERKKSLTSFFGEQGHGFSRITSPDKLTEGERR